MSDALLELLNISKEFPGVVAVDDISIEVDRGEIVAIVGENGAGKSTLMRIVAGVHPEGTFRGEVRLGGRKVTFDGVPAAEAVGIVMIPQELNVIGEFTVAESIFLNREPQRFGMIRTDEMRREAGRLLRDFELAIDVNAPMKTLGIAMQQLIEITKALSKNASVVILDEPTSSLSITESEHLFTRLRELRRRGVACLYISHRLGEVLDLADRVVVMRDGRLVGSDDSGNMSHERIVSMMLGRDIDEVYPKELAPPGDIALEVVDFSVPDPELPGRNVVDRVSLRIHKGEVVGLFGLVGAGRTEFVTALFGAWPVEPTGEVRINGKRVQFRSPANAIDAGVALLTEDRKRFGLIDTWGVQQNLSLASLEHLSRMGVIDGDAEAELAKHAAAQLAIKTPTLRHPIGGLSGGNQQKVLLGRWLARHPALFLLDEPTRGIDVGAKVEIFHLLNRLALQGIAVLFVSSELQEVMAMSDRIVVMWKGRVSGEFSRNDANEESVMLCATGGA